VTRALFLAAALVLVPAAGGATETFSATGSILSPGQSSTIGTRGAVASISADGGRVAIHAQLGDDPRCDFGAVWQPARKTVLRLGRDTCPQTADAEFDELTLAGNVAAWTNYDFGNHAYCSGPYAANLATRSAIRTGACPGEPDNADMYWEFKGSGSLLVARSYTRCEENCGPDFSGSYDADVVIWSVGPAGLRKLVAAKRDTELLDVDAGRIVLRDPAKKLLVLNRVGNQVGSLAADAQAAWLSGAENVSIPRGTTLHTYDLATGKVVETCTLKRGAKVQDVENGLAVYFVGNEVHPLTIATNADRVVARRRGLVAADLEPGGLFYAYNIPGGGAKPGRVTFLPLK
jgi:hypothetical protein